MYVINLYVDININLNNNHITGNWEGVKFVRNLAVDNNCKAPVRVFNISNSKIICTGRNSSIPRNLSSDTNLYQSYQSLITSTNTLAHNPQIMNSNHQSHIHPFNNHPATSFHNFHNQNLPGKSNNIPRPMIQDKLHRLPSNINNNLRCGSSLIGTTFNEAHNKSSYNNVIPCFQSNNVDFLSTPSKNSNLNNKNNLDSPNNTHDNVYNSYKSCNPIISISKPNKPSSKNALKNQAVSKQEDIESIHCQLKAPKCSSDNVKLSTTDTLDTDPTNDNKIVEYNTSKVKTKTLIDNISKKSSNPAKINITNNDTLVKKEPVNNCDTDNNIPVPIESIIGTSALKKENISNDEIGCKVENDLTKVIKTSEISDFKSIKHVITSERKDSIELVYLIYSKHIVL